MKMSEILRRFFMSPRGIVVSGIAAAAAVAAVIAGLSVPAAVLTGLFIEALGLGATVFTGSGARSLVAEGERQNEQRNRERLAEAAAVSKTLGRLRIADSGIRNLTARLCYEADTYIEYCKNTPGAVYDPQILDNIDAAKAAVNTFLKRENRTAADRHLAPGGSDDPGADGNGTLKSGTAAVLERVAAEIRERNEVFAAGEPEAALPDWPETDR